MNGIFVFSEYIDCEIMEFLHVSIGIFIILWTAKQGDTCSVSNWNAYSLDLRLYEAQNVLVGSVTFNYQNIGSDGFEYRYLTVNVSCVLKDTQSLSVKNTLEIRERVLSICNLEYDLVMDEETIIMFRYDTAKDVYVFDHVNYEAPQVRATQANLDTALEQCGFQNPYVPRGVTNQGTCSSTTVTNDCRNIGTAAAINMILTMILSIGGVVIPWAHRGLKRNGPHFADEIRGLWTKSKVMDKWLPLTELCWA